MKKNMGYTIGTLIILLICAFVFVILPAFTGTAGNGKKAPAFGEWNKKAIRYEQGSDMADFVTRYAQQYQNYGVQLDSSTYYYIFNYAFNSTVMKYAYTDFVKKTGYKVPKEAVNRGMRPYFSDENGNYSSKLYKQADQTQVADLQSDIESSLTTQRFYDDNFGSDTDAVAGESLYGLKESDAEMDFLTGLGTNKRGFQVAVFPLSEYPDSEKAKYGDQNAAKFVKYDLSVITVEDKSTAKTVAKRLAAEEITFDDAISEYSEKTYSNSDGKITNSYQYQIENILTDKADIDKVAGLLVDAVTDVIETNGSFSIFKCNAPVVFPDFTDSETLRVVGNYITGNENTIVEDYFTAKAKDFTSEALNTSFDEAGTKLGVTTSSIAPFPLNYGNVSIADKIDTSVTGLSGAETNENFLKTAFSLKKNEISAPIVLNNNIVVLQYTSDEIKESADSVSDISTYDQDAAQNSIMDNSKLTNNFASVYFTNYMSND